jgi:nucleoside-specific outer membrane channel protein Tsx
MKIQNACRAALISTFVLMGSTAQAADWSDTSIGYRRGTEFAEPFNSKDIKKSILNLNHVSGYKYGSNFFNADYLMSDSKDPAFAGANTGATEIYVVYRHTLDLGKITGQSFKFGPIRGFGLTAGLDYNTKNDAGYNSSKQMLVAGPTVMLDVPGFLNVSLLQLWESNAPYSTFSHTGVNRYHYDPHPMLNLAWGVSAGLPGLSFEGFANFITAKGKNESGADTGAETNIDMQLMYDLSPVVGAAPKTIKVGLENQWWKNKFGNKASGPAGSGAFAKTPMIRAEYHF